jgi:hypothetical protein
VSFEDTIRQVIREELRAVLREELAAHLGGSPGPDAGGLALLSVEQVAKLCHTKPKAVRAWIAEGKLSARKGARRLLVAPVDLERFLAGAPRKPPTVKGEVLRIMGGL